MSTKEIAVSTKSQAGRLFDLPGRLDWFEDLLPWGMYFRNPEWKSIKIEEFIKDKKFVVRAEMPGVDPDKDIEVSIADGYLMIKGERREEMRDDHHCEFSYGSFSRSIALPNGYDEKNIHADYKDGVLQVSVDLPNGVSKGMKIPVNKSRS